MATSDEWATEFRPVQDGPWVGWQIWVKSPFETHAGPFYWRVDDGNVTGAWVPDDQHLNDVGTIHGGALMTFADAAAGGVAYFATEGKISAVTVAFSSQFIAAGTVGEPVYATGRVIRETGTMLFVQGELTQLDQPILTFSSVGKKITPR